ncbi:MAG: OmpA family protein [Saprospiraceae bacterium]|nr:OmpA family protein [Saprospiraceae bacterium]
MRFAIIFLLMASCVTRGIRSPKLAYDVKRYALAAQLYLREYEIADTKKEKSEIAFIIGDCYDKMGKFTLSKQWYKKSYDLEPSNKTLISYAFALKKNEEYQDAMDAFAELNNEIQGMPIFRKEAKICKQAKDMKKNQNPLYRYHIEKFYISSDANDYSAIYDSKGRITFSSDKLGTTGKNKYDWSGNFFSDIYVTNNKETVLFSDKVNSQSNEGSVCWNSDETILYFTRCEDLNVGNYYCQIYKHNVINQEEDVELLNLGGNLSNTQHPALHYTDSILIYSSDREGSVAQYDLYISFLRDGKWTLGLNLGQVINTEGNEKFPVWYKDTLYFSSDGHPGFGGLDIYKTWRLTNQQWSIPQRLEYPVNSGADDFSYSHDLNFKRNDSILEKAIFSSNRNQDSGDDIYTVVKKSVQPKTTERSYVTTYQVKLNYFKTNEYGNQQIHEILDSVTVQLNNESTFSTKQTNTITFNVKEGQNLIVRSGRPGFLNQEIIIPVSKIENILQDTIIKKEIEISLIPIQYNKEYLLKNVYYDLNQSFIRDDAKPALDELYSLMLANPSIKVLISSHTDCRADDMYNMSLSEERAKSAKTYLLRKGISDDRIQYKGYGETEPVALCQCESCTEDEHQRNRRSGFKLIR